MSEIAGALRIAGVAVPTLTHLDPGNTRQLRRRLNDYISAANGLNPNTVSPLTRVQSTSTLQIRRRLADVVNSIG